MVGQRKLAVRSGIGTTKYEIVDECVAVLQLAPMILLALVFTPVHM